jgi:hypothetical protein
MVFPDPVADDPHAGSLVSVPRSTRRINPWMYARLAPFRVLVFNGGTNGGTP